jgi:hypothetical protein
MVVVEAKQHQSLPDCRSLGALREVGPDRGCMGPGMQYSPRGSQQSAVYPELICYWMRVYSTYGSGYPGVLAPHGVSGLGFPYYFWPVVWYDNGQSGYLFDSAEVRQEYHLPRSLVSLMRIAPCSMASQIIHRAPEDR